MTKKTKIFIEASAMIEPRISGIGHATIELTRALSQHPDNGVSFEIILVVSYDRQHFLERWDFKNVSRKIVPLPLRGLNLLWKYNLLPPMDLYIGKGTYIFPNYKNWRLLRSRSLTYVHDISFVLFPESVSPKNQKFLQRNMPKWLKRTTVIAADSESAHREIVEYYKVPEEKVVVLHHGVNVDVYKPAGFDAINDAKHRHGITGNYLFYLGNFEPRKNLIALIEAYKKLPKALINRYSLVMVGGSGWLNEPILQAIRQAQQAGYPIVKPDHFVEDADLPALHSGATLLVHPALYEGFGLSLVQAMACGTPVLAGNNSSMIEVVGDAGRLVDASNVDDISRSMQQILEDEKLRRQMSERGLLQARKFLWTSTAAKLVDKIQEINHA
jgi:glycosyltransferase involved in cell wall biosynthesis